MMRFLVRLVLNALAIGVAAWLLPGLILSGPGAALLAALILGMVNTLVRPVLLVLTLPLTLLTLGFFIFVVNAICLALTAAALPGFEIAGFWSALFGALVVSVVSWILNGLLVPKERRRVVEVARRG